jgi:hypothetical protein
MYGTVRMVPKIRTKDRSCYFPLGAIAPNEQVDSM